MDIVEQATNIIDEAQKRNVILRAVGGIAIAIKCPSAKHRNLIRKYADIDLVGHAKQDKDIKKILVDLGFEPNKRFNALHGKKRLQFWDMKRHIDIDIFLDIFEMCHKFNLRDRLYLDKYTIPLSDLLMTKLQIVELNEKDIRDIIAMLKDYEFGREEPKELDLNYIAKLCSGDWGLHRTLTMNAEKIIGLVEEYDLEPAEKKGIMLKLKTFIKKLEDEPKSLKWRMRAKVGGKWYETVEEVKR